MKQNEGSHLQRAKMKIFNVKADVALVSSLNMVKYIMQFYHANLINFKM